MARPPVDLGSGGALLDLGSFGRAARVTLTRKQARTIAYTVRRSPEVMVKVSGGARTVSGVQAHFAYIGRDGELGVEVDHGFNLVRKGFEKKLATDWDLDLLAHRSQDERSILGKRRSPKLVHNLIFSMPPGTSPRKVLAAVRKLAVNEFALQHRYALVLYRRGAPSRAPGRQSGKRARGTVEYPQDDVAPLAQAVRRKLAGAGYRSQRAVRGESRTPKKDGIYRAARRGESTRKMEELRDYEPHRTRSCAACSRGADARADPSGGRNGVAGCCARPSS